MNKIKQIKCVATNGDIEIPNKDYKYTILYFYPKDSTPGCTIEGRDFASLKDEFAKKDIVIYGVSKDSIESHNKFITKQGFNFDLISDTQAELCKEFGVLQIKKMFGKEYMGIVRSTFIISADGEIIKKWSSVKVKEHAQKVLDYCQNL